MGVLNVTPDSFSDGGKFLALSAAVDRAAAMIAEGALIVDVGGESTRPGAAPVGVAEEIDRVAPVIEAVAARFNIVISVDTGRPEVMQAATAVGATLINDVRALQQPGALQAAANSGAAICLMHMQGQPSDMQRAPRYADVVLNVASFLRERLHACIAAGVAPDKILLDPGFGFGKSLQHNLELLRHLPTLADIGPPLLVGLSRKSMLGEIARVDVENRLPVSVAAATLAVWFGASVVRAHDVAATAQALSLCNAVKFRV